MKKQDRQKIISTLNVTNGFISHLVNGRKFTIKKRLAVAIAQATGKDPIRYIHPKRRKEFLKDFPELRGKKPRRR